MLFQTYQVASLLKFEIIISTLGPERSLSVRHRSATPSAAQGAGWSYRGSPNNHRISLLAFLSVYLMSLVDVHQAIVLKLYIARNIGTRYYSKSQMKDRLL